MLVRSNQGWPRGGDRTSTFWVDFPPGNGGKHVSVGCFGASLAWGTPITQHYQHLHPELEHCRLLLSAFLHPLPGHHLLPARVDLRCLLLQVGSLFGHGNNASQHLYSGGYVCGQIHCCGPCQAFTLHPQQAQHCPRRGCHLAAVSTHCHPCGPAPGPHEWSSASTQQLLLLGRRSYLPFWANGTTAKQMYKITILLVGYLLPLVLITCCCAKVGERDASNV